MRAPRESREMHYTASACPGGRTTKLQHGSSGGTSCIIIRGILHNRDAALSAHELLSLSLSLPLSNVNKREEILDNCRAECDTVMYVRFKGERLLGAGGWEEKLERADNVIMESI